MIYSMLITTKLDGTQPNPNHFRIHILESTIPANMLNTVVNAFGQLVPESFTKARRHKNTIEIDLDTQKFFKTRGNKMTLNKKIQTDDLTTACTHTQTEESPLVHIETQTEADTVIDTATQTETIASILTSNNNNVNGQNVDSNRLICAVKRSAQENSQQLAKRAKINLELVFNEKALLNISGIEIPQNVQLIISLGPNFVKPINSVDEIQILSDLSRIKTENNFPHISNAAIKQMLGILKKSTNKKSENQKQELINGYIDETIAFLEEHNDLMVDVSDKGKKSIIMKKQDYLEKVYEKLSDKITYEEIETSSHIGLLKRNHKLLTKCFEQGFVTKDGIMESVSNETQYSKMYALIKSHKDGHPVRLINAKINAIGNKLTSIVTGILNKMNENDPFNIPNTKSLISSLKQLKLDDNDRLFTADIVDMFTNISAVDALKIITNKEIAKYTNMTAELFTEIFKFVTLYATEFIFNDQKFKMIRGLPMGGGASPVISSLVTTDWLNQCLTSISPDKIKYLGKYVDDLIIVGDKIECQKLFAILNTHSDLRFKVEEEENSTVNYLDLTIIRNFDRIQTKWYAKPYASHRLINWHSSHDRSQTMQTAKQFVGAMFSYSDLIFYDEIEYLAHKVLHLNSFPINTAKVMIESIIKSNGKLTKAETSQNVKYVGTSAPWELLSKMNKSLDKFFDGNLKMVNKVQGHNLKGSVFSHEKDGEDIELINNAVITIECKTCRFFYVTAITTPLKLFTVMKLPNKSHPLHGIRHHLDKVNHAGFNQKILYRCANTKETYRIAELVAIRKRAKLLGVDNSANEKHILDFAQKTFNLSTN